MLNLTLKSCCEYFWLRLLLGFALQTIGVSEQRQGVHLGEATCLWLQLFYRELRSCDISLKVNAD